MRKHSNEMIRFANSEDDTEVWHKHKDDDKWEKAKRPGWYDNYTYVVDDEYAELRKKSIDTGRPIQVLHSMTKEWETPTLELDFNMEIGRYRVKPKEQFEYPIYKKSKSTGCIVKFTDITEGVIIKETNKSFKAGYTSNTWIEHTNNITWEDTNLTETTCYYRWEKLYSDGSIDTTKLVSDEYAKRMRYEEQGWRKIESSKRTWEN